MNLKLVILNTKTFTYPVVVSIILFIQFSTNYPLFIQFNSTFGTGEYLVRRYKFIPLYELTIEEVGQKIASHCEGMKMVLIKRFLSGDIDAEATKLFTRTQ